MAGVVLRSPRRRRGYSGKWHLGNDGVARRGAHAHDPLRNQPSRVFDPAVHEHSYEQTAEKYAGQADRLERGRPPFWGVLRDELAKDGRMSQAVDGAVQFLEESARDRTEPFLLTVSIGPPHFPHYLPPEYAKRAEARAAELPSTLRDTFDGRPDFHGKHWWPSMHTSGLSDDDWRQVIAYTLTHVEMVDDTIGVLFDKLKTLGFSENTTVVFTSDHGDMAGAHGRFDKGPYFYDEVWRIPLIIRRPGCSAAEQSAFCDLLDVAETLFRGIAARREGWRAAIPCRRGATGVAPSKEPVRSGRDLMPLVGADAVPADWRQRAHGYYDLYNGMSFAVRAIRDERWAYVWNPQSVDELYDMESDPIQMQNRIDDPAYAEQRTRLRAEQNEWIASIGDDLPSRASDLPSAGTIVATGEMGP